MSKCRYNFCEASQSSLNNVTCPNVSKSGLLDFAPMFLKFIYLMFRTHRSDYLIKSVMGSRYIRQDVF